MSGDDPKKENQGDCPLKEKDMTMKHADAEWYRTTMSRLLNNRGTTEFFGLYITKNAFRNHQESPAEKKRSEEPASGKPSGKPEEK